MPHVLKPSHPSPRAAIIILAIGQTICWAGLLYSFAAFLLAWEENLGWAKTDLTIALTVAILISALAAPIAGRIVDAGGGRWLLTFGGLGGALALAGLSMVTTRTGFIVIWALLGVMQGACLYETCFAFMTRMLGAAARPAIIRLTLIAGFASPLAFTGAALLTDAFGWRGAMQIFALAVAVVGAPLHYVGARMMETGTHPEPVKSVEPGARGVVQTAIRKPAFWLIALAFPVMALNHGMLLNHILPLLAERGFSRTTAVTAASLIGPMQVAGRLIVMGFENRVATLTVTLISFAGVIVAALLLLAAGLNTTLVFAFAATQGAAYGLISILRPAVISETLGRDGFGIIAGWLAVPYLAGFALAPWIGALLWELGGYDLAITVAAGLGVVGLASIAILAATQKRTVASSKSP
ncbi:MAG: MFS transporter [Hyphomicrobiaceae bacterium]